MDNLSELLVQTLFYQLERLAVQSIYMVVK